MNTFAWTRSHKAILTVKTQIERLGTCSFMNRMTNGSRSDVREDGGSVEMAQMPSLLNEIAAFVIGKCGYENFLAQRRMVVLTYISAIKDITRSQSTISQ
jgi:hypothetical protein